MKKKHVQNIKDQKCRRKNPSASVGSLCAIFITFVCSLKARFHYERGKKHSLFVLLLFFCARFNFNRSLQSKINKREKECSFPRS